MNAGPAFQALIAAAALVGFEPAPVPPAVIRAVADERPKEILRLSLSEIARDQARAAQRQTVGRGAISFSVGFDPEAALWIKLEQERRIEARTWAQLEQGFELDLPVEPVRFVLEQGMVRAIPLTPPYSPQTSVSFPSLLRGLTNAAVQVQFAPVTYSVVYEDGSSVPASICLIREDREGRFWVTHNTLAELRAIQWFVSINGSMRGMRLEDQELVFYSKPTPVIPYPRKAETALLAR